MLFRVEHAIKPAWKNFEEFQHSHIGEMFGGSMQDMGLVSPKLDYERYVYKFYFTELGLSKFLKQVRKDELTDNDECQPGYKFRIYSVRRELNIIYKDEYQVAVIVREIDSQLKEAA